MTFCTVTFRGLRKNLKEKYCAPMPLVLVVGSTKASMELSLISIAGGTGVPASGLYMCIITNFQKWRGFIYVPVLGPLYVLLVPQVLLAFY